MGLDNDRVKTPEVIGYGMGNFAANFSASLLNSYLLIYMTDFVGASAALIGTIFLATRVFDGVSDLGMGFLIERTNTRWGKARPWLLFTAPILGLLLILTFNFPATLGINGTTVFVACLYFIFNVFAYTAYAVSYNTLSNYISHKEHDRMRLGSSSALFLFVAAAAAGFVPQYRSLLGGPRDGYSRVAIVFAIATILAILVTFFSTKERASMKPKDKSSASPKEMLKVMLGDRHFYMTVAVFFLVNATNVGSFNMIYFVKYYLGDENLNAYLTFAGLIPMAIGMFFAPALAKKLGMRKAFICGICSSVIGSLISWLGGANVMFLALGMAIKAFGYAPAFASILAFIGNVGNYLYWKSGVPVQSVMFSATSASQKLGAGFAAGMAGWLLTLGKYAPNAEVQPESAIFVMRFSVIIWPVIMMLGILVLLLGFGIMKKTDKIDLEIKEGKFANGRTWRDL